MARRWLFSSIGGTCIGAAALAAAAGAQAAIYSCIDGSGKKITSDRPIPECAQRDQRVLNPDGSVRRILPPTPTAEERAEQEAREQRAAAQRAAYQDAVRRDRNLLMRFPDEAAHQKARAAALDDVEAARRRSEKRLEELAAERKPLLDETEFYKKRSMPPKLKQALEANETATEAQRVLVHNHEAEAVRINGLFDTELARLRKLWAGAPPGSMGTLQAGPAASGVVGATAAK
jgi:hypothetical protein